MKDVIGWRTDDAVELIRGAANSKLRLDIVPAEAPLDSKPVRVLLTRAKVRLEDARALKAQCRCSADRIGTVLASFGPEERADMVEPDGKIHVTCEYCATVYKLDPGAVEAQAEA